MDKIKAMILSAGIGERLRPLTNKTPKAMIPIGGKPLLQHQIELLKGHGIRDFVINLHHLPDQIINYFRDGSQFGVSIAYTREPTILGTAGGIKNAERLLSDPFLVIYADNLTNMDITSVIKFHRQHHGPVTLTVYDSPSPETMGVVLTDGNDNIIGFLEKHPNPPTSEVSAGICIYDKAILRYIPPGVFYDQGKDLYPDLLRRGVLLKRFNPHAYVQDTGTKERYAKAQKDYENGVFN